MSDTEEQIEQIYVVKARMQNKMAEGGASLTPAGNALLNLYVHVIMDLYAFAETLSSDQKAELESIILSHEDMPAKLLQITRRK